MPHSANDIEQLDQELLSKSEIKREMHRLQDFAMRLIKMSKHQRSKLPLTDELKDAMVLADKIENKHEALRRHVRYIAKVLAETDLEPINQAIDFITNKHQQESNLHNRYSQLREALISDSNDLIEKTLEHNPNMERQKLRQLVRQTKKEREAEREGKYHKELLNYLKSHCTHIDDQIT